MNGAPRSPGPKTPFLLRRRGDGLIGFAGLWETFLDPSGGEIDTACIVTTIGQWRDCRDPRPHAGDYRARTFRRMARPRRNRAPPLHLLRPADEDAIEFFAISPLVNRASHDGPEIQAPV